MNTHLDDDTFERLAMRELDDVARTAALKHVVECPRCAAIHKALLGVESGARAAKLPGVPPRTASHRKWFVAATALVAAAAVLLLWLGRKRDPEELPTTRGSNGSIVLGSPAGDARIPVELSWQSTRATSYRVQVFDLEGKLVWTRDVAAPPVRWPDEVPARPTSYRWKVEALDGNTVIDESSLGSFRIVP